MDALSREVSCWPIRARQLQSLLVPSHMANLTDFHHRFILNTCTFQLFACRLLGLRAVAHEVWFNG